MRSTAMCVRPQFQSHTPVAPLNTYTFLNKHALTGKRTRARRGHIILWLLVGKHAKELAEETRLALGARLHFSSLFVACDPAAPSLAAPGERLCRSQQGQQAR